MFKYIKMSETELKLRGSKARITNPITYQVKTNSKGSELRSFMCVSINGKEFESRAQKVSPNLAAGSMFSQWIQTQTQKQKQKKLISAFIILRESTRGSLQKKYKYTVTRTKLEEPIEKAKGVFVKYDTKIVSEN